MSSGQRDPSLGLLVALVGLALALYLPNLGDYFLGDDFDLIVSFHGQPARYFLELLVRNESGDVWRSLGLDPELGRGYLRPVKIWLLKLDTVLWHTNPVGFHATSTLLFAGVVACVFLALRVVLPGRPALAFVGAWMTAVHPVFAEVVPFITAREEFLVALFGLGSFVAFLRHRRHGASPLWIWLLLALALLSKESALGFAVLPVAWDFVHGRLRARELPSLLRLHAPVAALLAAYFALRWFAFGNLKGGDGLPTSYLSLTAFARFHEILWASLFDRTQLLVAGVPGIRLACGGIALAAFSALGLRRARISKETWCDLAFFGAVWYLASTLLLHGTSLATRRHVPVVVGLAIFVTRTLAALLEAGVLRSESRVALACVGIASLVFVPPTLETGLEFRRASRAVEAIRRSIEQRTADLPDGSTVSIEGAPQWVLPPFFFGWGLRSSLQQPFTESDLSRRVQIVNRRDLEINQAYAPWPPTRVDRAIVIAADDEWVTPEMRRRREHRRVLHGLAPGEPDPSR